MLGFKVPLVKHATKDKTTTAQQERKKGIYYSAILQINFNKNIKRSSRYTHKRQAIFLPLAAHTNRRGA